MAERSASISTMAVTTRALSHLAGEYKILDESNICSYNGHVAAQRPSRPKGDVLKEVIAIVEKTANRHATGSAAPAELAIARDLVRLPFASAELGENFVTEELSHGVWTDVDRLRRACLQYDLRLWQTAPAFWLAK